MSELSISNHIEGPLDKRLVLVRKDDYLKQDQPFGVATWMYEQMLGQLLSGTELNQSILLASKEFQQRIIQNKAYFVEDITLVEGSDKYSFRGLRRSTNQSPIWRAPSTATVEQLNRDLFLHGVDVPGEPLCAMPRTIFHSYAFPTEKQLLDGEDITVILVYKYNPKTTSYVIPRANPDYWSLVKRINPTTFNGIPEPISKIQAEEHGYETLRNLLVGQIEVNYK